MLTVAFREPTKSRTQVLLWYNRIKESRNNKNDDTLHDRSRTSRTYEYFEAVKKMILDNHRITIREFADNADDAHAKQFLWMF